jgi:hypothetical protein
VADARDFAPALSTAVHRLESQVASVRRSRRSPRDGDRTG